MDEPSPPSGNDPGIEQIPFIDVVRRQVAALERVFGKGNVPAEPGDIYSSNRARTGYPYRFLVYSYPVCVREGEYQVVHAVTFLQRKGSEKRWAPVNGYVRFQEREAVVREAYRRLDRMPSPQELNAGARAGEEAAA